MCAPGGEGAGRLTPPDARWNRGGDPSGGGRFCAFCAAQTPPALARHRHIECQRRLLCGMPDYTADSLARLEADIAERAARSDALRKHLRRTIAARHIARTLHQRLTFVVRFLRRYEKPLGLAAPPDVPGSLRLRTSEASCGLAALPMRMGAAGVVEERRRLGSYVSSHVSVHSGCGPSEAPTRSGGAWKARWRGAAQVAAAQNQWHRLKALYQMRPRGSLVAGGLAELPGADGLAEAEADGGGQAGRPAARFAAPLWRRLRAASTVASAAAATRSNTGLEAVDCADKSMVWEVDGGPEGGVNGVALDAAPSDGEQLLLSSSRLFNPTTVR